MIDFIQLISDAAKASPFGKSAPLSEINKFIAVSLTQAKDRLAKRKKGGERGAGGEEEEGGVVGNEEERIWEENNIEEGRIREDCNDEEM